VCFIVRKTISKLEHVILTILFLLMQKTPTVGTSGREGLQCTFPLYVSMVTSPKLSFITNGDNPTGVGLATGETIHFGNLEFTAEDLGHLSLSPYEGNSSIIFVGMVYNGSLSLHTVLKNFSDEGGTASGAGGSSGSPGPQGHNVVTRRSPSPIRRRQRPLQHS
jgi:hypothetical protein